MLLLNWQQLASWKGILMGTYGGTRVMTRYEAALVFARTLARFEAMVERSLRNQR